MEKLREIQVSSITGVGKKLAIFYTFVYMQNKEKDILNLIRKKLKTIAPDAKAILFGSRARGNPSKNSDWDILVLLDKSKIESSDYDNIAYPLFELGWQVDEHFSIKLYTHSEWHKRSFTMFYKNVEQEGIVL